MPKPLTEMNILVAGWGKASNLHLSDIEDFQELGVSQKILLKVAMPLVPFAKCR